MIRNQRAGATYLRPHSREVAGLASNSRYPDPDLGSFPRIPCRRQCQGVEQHSSAPRALLTPQDQEHVENKEDQLRCLASSNPGSAGWVLCSLRKIPNLSDIQFLRHSVSSRCVSGATGP